MNAQSIMDGMTDASRAKPGTLAALLESRPRVDPRSEADVDDAIRTARESWDHAE